MEADDPILLRWPAPPAANSPEHDLLSRSHVPAVHSLSSVQYGAVSPMSPSSQTFAPKEAVTPTRMEAWPEYRVLDKG